MKNTPIIVFVVLACISCAFALLGRTQSSGATGTLLCNGKPATGILIKLYDEDDTDLDDLLGKTETNSEGYFKVSGHTDEYTPIDPKVNIYHDCNDDLPCQRKFTIKIPDSFITSGSTAQKFLNIGTIELAGKFSGESRDCIH